MQTLPTNWETIRRGIHRAETKLTISGVEYSEEEIISLSTSSALFSKRTASVGGCVAKQIDLLVKPKSDIPRMAEIRLSTRLVAQTYFSAVFNFMEPQANHYSVVTPDGQTYYFALDYMANPEHGYLENYVMLRWSVSGGLTGEAAGRYKENDMLQSVWKLDDIPFTQYAAPGAVVAPIQHSWNNSGSEYSEWLPKGVFYIDTRRNDAVMGTLTIHGYDAMMKSEKEYLEEGDTGEWPRAADVVVSEIATAMGIELDERTVIDPSSRVPYPNDWTMREVLGYIAVAHCGNWVITDAGKLRLVPFGILPEETDYLVDEHGDAITFGGVKIIV